MTSVHHWKTKVHSTLHSLFVWHSNNTLQGATLTMNNKTFGRLFFTLAQSSVSSTSKILPTFLNSFTSFYLWIKTYLWQEGILLYSSLRVLSRSIRLTFWEFTGWWTATMTDLSINRTEERTTYITGRNFNTLWKYVKVGASSSIYHNTISLS